MNHLGASEEARTPPRGHGTDDDASFILRNAASAQLSVGGELLLSANESLSPSTKRKLTEAELRSHLLEGLINLEELCAAFDAGRPYVAFYMATDILRILQSNTLAKQLADARLFPSPREVSGHNLAVQIPQITIAALVKGTWPNDMETFEAKAQPILANGGAAERLPFESWWKDKAIYLEGGLLPEGSPPRFRKTLSRNELVRMMRDKLGAHLDEAIPTELHQLQQAASFGINIVMTFEDDDGNVAGRATTEDGTLPTSVSPAAAMMRQIAWEVLEAYSDELAQARWRGKPTSLGVARARRGLFSDARDRLVSAADALFQAELLRVSFGQTKPFRVSHRWDSGANQLLIVASLVEQPPSELMQTLSRAAHHIIGAFDDATHALARHFGSASDPSMNGDSLFPFRCDPERIIACIEQTTILPKFHPIFTNARYDLSLPDDVGRQKLTEFAALVSRDNRDIEAVFVPLSFPSLFELPVVKGETLNIQIEFPCDPLELSAGEFLVAQMNENRPYDFHVITSLILQNAGTFTGAPTMDVLRNAADTAHRFISELEQWASEEIGSEQSN